MLNNIILDINIYIPVILKVIWFICLLYIPLPIVLWIYRSRTGSTKNNNDKKFDALGTFQGFKITAGGSVALYFILLLVCLSSSIPIASSIDNTQKANEVIDQLKFSKDSILSHSPWKLQYGIRLMTDSIHEVTKDVYINYLNTKHFHPFPPSLSLDQSTHLISCYIDNDLFLHSDDNYRVNIDDFNSSFELHIKPETKGTNRVFDL